MSEPRDETRAAGRGFLYTAGAKIFFVITSYGVQLVLTRLWSENEFGLFSATIATVSILTNVLIAATIQTVSKFVSEDDAAAPARLRQGVKLQLAVGSALGVAFFLLAPVLAGLLEDGRLAPLLRISSAVVVSYAVYAALVGSLNGRRLFSRQAGLDITFSTLRTGGLIGAAALGFGVLGAVAGFAGAAISILLIALVVVGVGKRGPELPVRTFLAFMAPIWLYQLLLNGIMQLDVLVLKKTLAELFAETQGLAEEAAAHAADAYVGRYRAAQLFAFVPYQLLLSMTFIVFPMVSRATTKGDDELAKMTIRGSLRTSLLILLGIATPVAGAANGVLLLAYRPEYVTAGSSGALGVLVFGMVAFSLFVTCATVLSGSGRPGLSAIIAGGALLALVTANRFLVLAVGIDDRALLMTATATTLGTTLALAAAATAVFLRFRALIAPLTVLRALIASGAGYAVASLVPHANKLLALVALAAGFAAYVAALAVTRELGGADFAIVKRVLGKKKKA